MDTIRLHRPLHARLFATTLQGALTVAAAISLLTFALGAGNWSRWPLLLVQAVLLLVWLRALTGWARIDDQGLHWRYWIRREHSWDAMRTVTLTRHANFLSYRVAGPAIIVVRDKDGEEYYVVPALRCGRRRREFASAVLDRARGSGVRIEVASEGWTQHPLRLADPWA